jgi:hypothetical protein
VINPLSTAAGVPTAPVTSGAAESVPPPSTPPSPAGPASSAAPSRPTGTGGAGPSSSSSSGAAPTDARSTCTKIGIRVIRGSASPGQEIAALQFSNDGATSCRLVGYPEVTLLRNGAPIGSVSQPSRDDPSSRTLAPGEVAESLLHDYSSCQAPLSDQLRVTAPGSSVVAVRPGQLRACTLRVDRLGAPD